MNGLGLPRYKLKKDVPPFRGSGTIPKGSWVEALEEKIDHQKKTHRVYVTYMTPTPEPTRMNAWVDASDLSRGRG